MFTLTGTLRSHVDGRPLAGERLLFLPTPARTVEDDGINLGGDERTTDEAGAFTVDLVALPGLVYTVRSIGGGPFHAVRFEVGEDWDGTTQQLESLTPVDAPGPFTPYLRGTGSTSVEADGGVLTITTQEA